MTRKMHRSTTSSTSKYGTLHAHAVRSGLAAAFAAGAAADDDGVIADAFRPPPKTRPKKPCLRREPAPPAAAGAPRTTPVGAGVERHAAPRVGRAALRLARGGGGAAEGGGGGGIFLQPCFPPISASASSGARHPRRRAKPRSGPAARSAFTEVLLADALGLVLYQLPLAHDIAAGADAVRFADQRVSTSGESATGADAAMPTTARARRALPTEVLPADALGLVFHQLPLAHDIAQWRQRPCASAHAALGKGASLRRP